MTFFCHLDTEIKVCELKMSLQSNEQKRYEQVENREDQNGFQESRDTHPEGILANMTECRTNVGR